MIEQRAVVVEMDGGGFAWVEKQSRESCDACSASGGCGSALLAGLAGKRHRRLRVSTDLSLSAGDEVVVGIPADVLVSGSVFAYIVPLLLMFMGAIFAELLVAAEGEQLSIIGGCVGLLGGLIWVRLLFRGSRVRGVLQPVILKRCDDGKFRYRR